MIKVLITILRVVFALLGLLSFSVQAQLATKKALTLEAAKKLAALAESEALKNEWTMVITVVDDGGNLMHLERMDNTQLGSIEVAIQKAKTTLSFKRPTKAFGDIVGSGKTDLLGLPGAIPSKVGCRSSLTDSFSVQSGLAAARDSRMRLSPTRRSKGSRLSSQCFRCRSEDRQFVKRLQSPQDTALFMKRIDTPVILMDQLRDVLSVSPRTLLPITKDIVARETRCAVAPPFGVIRPARRTLFPTAGGRPN